MGNEPEEHKTIKNPPNLINIGWFLDKTPHQVIFFKNPDRPTLLGDVGKDFALLAELFNLESCWHHVIFSKKGCAKIP